MDHSWRLPLSSRSQAELRICGGPLAPADFDTLKKYVNLIEETMIDGSGTQSVETPSAAEIVQLKTSADPVFGGLLLRVKQRLRDSVRGYLLVAHRGGCREAWHTAKTCEINSIGQLTWPEADFNFRSFQVVKNLNGLRGL